jgi:hypothetical protein
MDLMGSDAVQSEAAVKQMWGESMNAVKCQHQRITYDDFLLLMKGQSKEAPPQLDLGASVESLKGTAQLFVVEESHEGDSHTEGSPTADVPGPTNGDVALPGGMIISGLTSEVNGVIPIASPTNIVCTPSRPSWNLAGSQSAPSTPAGHRFVMDIDTMDSPLSMDEDDDINTSGPGVPGTSASLTPPMTPVRGVSDYVTPYSGRRMSVEIQEKLGSLALPGLTSKPDPYTRRRSRSVDDKEKEEGDLHAAADAVLDLILPETDHKHVKEPVVAVKEESKTALQVNRKIYRAHRQMRLAVLEASKRFEEQQTAHARDVILAKQLAENETDPSMGMIQAGLVMRHGHSKQDAEAIGMLLREDRTQQHVLVEKANRRGGRGRRSRKKTISDMSGMLSTSMGQDEMTLLADSAAKGQTPDPALLKDDFAVETTALASDSPELRGATVPGEFKRTSDPFGKQGRYGAVAAWQP